MTDILMKEEIAKTAITNMFRKDYFNICDYDSLCEMLNVFPDGETKRMLRPLHCIHYSDMSKPLRKWLFDTILSVTQCVGFDLKKAREVRLNSAFIDAEIIPSAPNFLQKLLA